MPTNHKPHMIATIYDKRGRILSSGENSFEKTHPKQARMAKRVGQPLRQYLHAELQAIIRLRGREVPYKIFIERYDCQGNPKMAKPCKICELAIIEAGIKRIEFTVG
jgi:deoxycytidylate deaminase